MALHGTLSSFPPSEIFQFISQSRKTGTLRIFDQTDAKLMTFDRGQLVYAVHVRALPKLTDLILFRGLATPEEVRQTVDNQDHWDDVVSRAQARRRLTNKPYDKADRRVEHVTSHGRDSRLGAILVARGRLRADQIQKTLEFANVPESLLEQIIKGAGLLSPKDIAEIRGSSDRPLYQLVIESGQVTQEQLTEMLAHISDETLAELIVFHGTVTRTEVRRILEQLERLRNNPVPRIRFGEYLLAKGKVSQRQLERALEVQLIEHNRIGEVLIDHGVLQRQDVRAALDDLAAIHSDFGLLQPLREKLADHQLVTPFQFTEIIDRLDPKESLVGSIVALGLATEQQMHNIIEDVLIDELCDLLLWQDASFEFFEGFSLEDAFTQDTLPRIHDRAFEVPSLLLDAHSTIDELQRTRFSEIRPQTVFVNTDQASRDPDVGDIYTADHRDIHRNLNGVKSFREVRSVLPGNRFSHRCLFARLLERGWIEPVSRKLAVERSRAAEEAGRIQEALDLISHALTQPGEEPSNAVLRSEYQRLKLLSNRHLLRAVSARFKTLADKVRDTKAWKATVNWIEAAEWRKKSVAEINRAFALLGRAFVYVAQGVPKVLKHVRGMFDDFLIRIGLARHLWAFEAKYVKPLQFYCERHGFPARTRKITYIVALAAMLGFMLTPGVTKPPPALGNNPFRSAIRQPNVVIHDIGSPTEVAPKLAENRVVVAGRDGKLRALRLVLSDGGRISFSPEWSVQVGEYGDILTEPVIAGGAVWVASVRGRVFKVRLDGKVLWRKYLPRVEPLPLTPLSTDGELVAVAVASRASVFILDESAGQQLFQFDTANRILCSPVGEDNLIAIGSADNRIYCVDWREGLLLWEHEASDDITSVQWMDGSVLFAARDGRLAALDQASGAELWKRDYPRNSVSIVQKVDDRTAFVQSDLGTVEMLSTDNGEEQRKFRPQPSRTDSRFQRGRFQYYSAGGTFGSISAFGEHDWAIQLPPQELAGWVVGDGLVIVLNVDGELSLIRIDQG